MAFSYGAALKRLTPLKLSKGDGCVGEGGGAASVKAHGKLLGKTYPEISSRKGSCLPALVVRKPLPLAGIGQDGPCNSQMENVAAYAA